MLDETVTLLLYDYFKQDGIVDHLMDVAARYTRCALLYPHAAEDAFLYLSSWVTALRRLREELGIIVTLDDEWLDIERALARQRNVGEHDTQQRPEDVLRIIFETQIDWCLTFFDACASYAEYATYRRGRPRTRQGFDRFTARAQQAWTQLTTVPDTYATTPPPNSV